MRTLFLSISIVITPFSQMFAQTTPTPNVISACVGNYTGIVREVNNAKECLKTIEAFQQWNVAGPTGLSGAMGLPGAVGATGMTGPSGPTGAQGPAGQALPHIKIVPAVVGGESEVTNGGRLQAVLSSITDASSTNPYVVQLDGGLYALTADLDIPAYVSLRGALAEATVIMQAPPGLFQVSFPKIRLHQNSTLADVTVDSYLPITVMEGAAPSIVLRDVQGGPNLMFDMNAGSSIKVENSRLGVIYASNQTNSQSTLLLVLGSQIKKLDFVQYLGIGSVGFVSGVNCISSFNNSFSLYVQNCRYAGTAPQ